MLKLKSQPTLIAAAIVSLFLLTFVSNSDAFEIEVMESSNGLYEDDVSGGVIYHTAYVRTDEAYYTITWYVGGNYAGYSSGDNQTTEAWFSVPSGLSGSLTGTAYEIKAVALSLEDDDGNHESDSDSYTLTVFEPTIVEVTGKETDVEATLTVHRHYYRHPMIYADLSASAYNPLDEDEIGKRLATRYVAAEFQLTVSGPNVNVADTGSAPRTKLPSLESLPSAYASLSCSIADGIGGGEYTSRAYVAIDADGPAPQNPDAQDYLEYIDQQSFQREFDND